MATKKRPPEGQPPRPRPATTPQGRENQMIGLAFSEAERQMREGTASAQVITHYLKLGSSRDRLERQRLESENELLRSKIDGMASAQESESMYAAALNAMRTYSGQEPGESDDYYDD